ncbi:hypothetical protein [Mesorhizobium escarrei]|uniref:Uncharacterized protein n=1 Tax=Mesorhizobium escarrei TaxID=666018 RepID=A0ABN8JNJ6_9HYPH|nr:hypothetical protein [Mesorhizobium escarrei]CAH2399607.1 hypothetical protein MES5069_230025 [Mesorhizobium escarrei]
MPETIFTASMFYRNGTLAPSPMGRSAQEYAMCLLNHTRNTARSVLVEGEEYIAALDLLHPNEMKALVDNVYRFAKRNCRACRTNVYGEDLLVIPVRRVHILATYIYHKAHGEDFRACFDELPVAIPELSWGRWVIYL